MRKLFLVFVTTLLFTIPLVPQERGHPIPPGVREADKLSGVPPEPPMKAKRHLPSAADIQKEADELAKLSATIPGQIELLRQGQFPKDLEEHLKRIQKLAKHLRSEISQ